MFPLNLYSNLAVKEQQTNDRWPEMNASCGICDCFPNFLIISEESFEYFPTGTRENIY